MDAALSKAAEHWSKPRNYGRTRFWNIPTILRHINRMICGEPLPGQSDGLARKLGELGHFKRGLSVGCGGGVKEMHLVEIGLVERFDLFEISATRVAQGRQIAESKGLSDRVAFHVADAFEHANGGYDLVHWNSALHHMLDVRKALRWSRDQLASGGVLAMYEFVGASRFQWPEEQLDYAERARALLPKAYLKGPWGEAPVRPERKTIEEMLAIDPTEAADSDRILPSLKEVFPGAEIVPTGGVIYHLALTDISANFLEDEFDAPLLHALLLLDETLVHQGMTHFAVATARK